MKINSFPGYLTDIQWTLDTKNPLYNEPLDTTNLRDGHHPDDFKWNRTLYNESLDTKNHLPGYKRVHCIQGSLYIGGNKVIATDAQQVQALIHTQDCIDEFCCLDNEDKQFPGWPNQYIGEHKITGTDAAQVKSWYTPKTAFMTGKDRWMYRKLGIRHKPPVW